MYVGGNRRWVLLNGGGGEGGGGVVVMLCMRGKKGFTYFRTYFRLIYFPDQSD